MYEKNEEKARDYTDNDDKTLLLVRGNLGDKEATKKYIKSLSSAIFTVMEKHDSAKLRCVGAGSLSNAVKALAVASGEFSKRGKTIAMLPYFQTVIFDEINERRALVLNARFVKLLDETNE